MLIWNIFRNLSISHNSKSWLQTIGRPKHKDFYAFYAWSTVYSGPVAGLLKHSLNCRFQINFWKGWRIFELNIFSHKHRYCRTHACSRQLEKLTIRALKVVSISTPQVKTAWLTSLSKFCSVYVCFVLNGLIRRYVIFVSFPSQLGGGDLHK